MSETVEYRIIADWQNYRVGSDGSIWSFKGGRRGIGWKILRGRPAHSGHLRVILCSPDGDADRYVHQLILEAFVGNCPPGLECRHLDGNPQNNRLENLKWGTRKENIADMERHGTSQRGERHSQARLSADQVLCVRAKLKRGLSAKSLASEFGVSLGTVYDIARGYSWSHLPGARKPTRRSPLQRSVVSQIKEMLRQGESIRSIAKELGVKENTIYCISIGKSYAK